MKLQKTFIVYVDGVKGTATYTDLQHINVKWESEICPEFTYPEKYVLKKINE